MIKRIAICYLLLCSAVLANGNSNSSHNNNNSHNKTVNNSTTQQQGQKQQQQQAAAASVNSSYYSSYEEAASTAIASVAHYCHTAAAGQGMKFGLSVTAISKVCELKSLAEFNFNTARMLDCPAQQSMYKDAVAVLVPDSCIKAKMGFYDEGMRLIGLATAEATRRPGVLKAVWRFVW